MSTIIIAAAVLQMTLIGLLNESAERRIASAFKNRREANLMAAGCMEHALNTLGRNATYTGNDTYLIQNASCQIAPILTDGSTWNLQVSLTLGTEKATVSATLSSRAPVTISTWQQ